VAIFKRTKDEDEEGDEELIDREEKEIKKFGKKFKDLKSVNKKKRKEPPLPWGKKERYIVLIVLIVTIVIAIILATGSQNSLKLDFGKPSFNFNFSQFNPFKEKIIIIDKR